MKSTITLTKTNSIMYKKIIALVFTVAGLMAIVLFSGCDDEIVPDTPNWGNIVEITDDITEPTVWSGDSIYVIRAWDFYVENTLTIEPGTIIKFHPDEG